MFAPAQKAFLTLLNKTVTFTSLVDSKELMALDKEDLIS